MKAAVRTDKVQAEIGNFFGNNDFLLRAFFLRQGGALVAKCGPGLDQQ